MKVLVDAQLPKKLANLLALNSIDSIHTLDLPEQNRTSDSRISQIADEQGRIVITKDSDFLDGYILNGKPKYILIVTVGNVKNAALLAIFEKNIGTLKRLFRHHKVIELTNDEIVVHF
ncbi:MAG: DUF5615 family PIN-like protein [Bacteroidetes bacterium]|nr:DUF5615 family PIN-like protein [Bacteroidota bacterium]